MNHDELVKWATDNAENAEYLHDEIGWKALKAVIEFHRPLGVVNGNPNKLVCACGEYMYPCPTIQAIEEELK